MTGGIAAEKNRHGGRQMKKCHIALPKGRREKAYAIFQAAGFECPSIKEENKLIFEKRIRACLFWVKPSDVVIYVERGAADIGIAGRDIILEYKPDIYSFY